jgi:hypothetical protein
MWEIRVFLEIATSASQVADHFFMKHKTYLVSVIGACPDDKNSSSFDVACSLTA